MHNKRVLSKIDLGKYKKPNPYSKDIITDPMGQWKYPGVPTRIPSSDITMQGVGYPVLGVADTGQTQMMMPGVDYTFPGANYVDEYPQAKKGGLVKMPKPSKKGLASKKFTSSVMGTSRLFTESPLFAKPKKKKNRIFDPNAKYYQDGGITTQEEIDAANNAMMKARLAYADMHGNPAAKRMVVAPDQPYDFGNGMMGTHYMASMDEYAVPQIQDVNGQLILGDYGPESSEAIRLDNPEDAMYFAEHYKDIAPAFIEAELTPEEIEEYGRGGFIVEDISVPQLTMQYGGDPKPKKNKKEVKPLVTSNLKEYAKRKQAYDDSLKLYNASLEEYNLLKKTKGALEDSPFYTKETYAAYKRLGYPEGYGMTVKRSDNSTVQAHFYEKPVQPVYKKSKQQKLVRSSNIKTNNKTKPKEKQYPTSYKPVVNNTPRKLPEGKIQVGEEKVQQLDPNTGQVTTVINPIYEDAMLPMQTLQPRHVDNTLRKFVELPSETSEEKVIEDTEDTIYTEDAGEPGPGGHWEDNTSRYIDWDGNSIGFNGIRFRKPGHGGDLIRKGKRHYIHYPSIEKRYDAWIQPEEYQNGGMILELSDEEISEYQKGGWIVEEL